MHIWHKPHSPDGFLFLSILESSGIPNASPHSGPWAQQLGRCLGLGCRVEVRCGRTVGGRAWECWAGGGELDVDHLEPRLHKEPPPNDCRHGTFSLEKVLETRKAQHSVTHSTSFHNLISKYRKVLAPTAHLYCHHHCSTAWNW